MTEQPQNVKYIGIKQIYIKEAEELYQDKKYYPNKYHMIDDMTIFSSILVV